MNCKNWTKEHSVMLGIYAAELLLSHFESVYSNDNRPRNAIEIAKKWLNGEIVNDEEFLNAWHGAGNAADDAHSHHKSALNCDGFENAVKEYYWACVAAGAASSAVKAAMVKRDIDAAFCGVAYCGHERIAAKCHKYAMEIAGD